ncbi:hypothetical protein EYF80_055923 [Liparis tanakae]|uniref:Uncharacterized protein n=1 Tax=Liparis tanakae TaxID=230148 RepID=A0A4Z2EYF3_9TELE|nr:hypothetical protein EYF80_055923 [Liparis tanakae]
MATNQNEALLKKSSREQVTWKQKVTCTQPRSVTAAPGYLSQVARDFDVVPGVVVELPVDRLHDGLEGPGAQVDDQRHGAVLQRQVDVVGRLARVQQQPVALPRLEGQRDLVAAALDGVLRQVVAEVLGAPEGSSWKQKRFFSGIPLKNRPRFHSSVRVFPAAAGRRSEQQQQPEHLSKPRCVAVETVSIFQSVLIPGSGGETDRWLESALFNWAVCLRALCLQQARGEGNRTGSRTHTGDQYRRRWVKKKKKKSELSFSLERLWNKKKSEL